MSCSIFAQKNKTAFYGELGGAGLATLNFDIRFHGNTGLGLRFGVGAGLVTISGKGIVLLPVEINYLIGKNGNSFLELGMGTTFYNGNKNDNLAPTVAFMNIGYRYAPAKGGLLFKVTYMPVISLPDKKFYPLWGGISLGVSF